MTEIVIIAHDMRSTHNVGALLRTADAFKARVYLTGYTPFPKAPDDNRLPHQSERLTKQIHKTALGAETDLKLWRHKSDLPKLIEDLKDRHFEVIALEQAKKSTPIQKYQPVKKVAILLGREVEGIEPNLIKLCDEVVEIPMLGSKESLNVVEAATTILYHCRYC